MYNIIDLFIIYFVQKKTVIPEINKEHGKKMTI